MRYKLSASTRINTQTKCNDCMKMQIMKCNCKKNLTVSNKSALILSLFCDYIGKLYEHLPKG
jgi:hypothetical protein